MGLYIYDTSQYTEIQNDLQLVRKHCRDLVSLGVRADNFRCTVKALMRHGVMVVPTDVQCLTPLVQRLQQIALITGIRVLPLASYVTQHGRGTVRQPLDQASAPVAASAVPPTQHPAAAGQPISR